MSTVEKRIVFTNDLDGVHFKAPPPLKTIFRLLQGDLSIPPENSPVGEYSPAKGCLKILSSRWSVFFHQIRPLKRDALEGLELFRQTAETYQRQLQFAALSGREQDKHAMTEARLQQAGYMQYFDRLFLNQGRNSSAWKESVVRQLVQEGLNVVHIDDDLYSALCFAELIKSSRIIKKSQSIYS